jgi:hypothetical protein
MTAQPIERHGHPHTPRIERRVGAIANALPPGRREQFMLEVRDAELGQPILDVIESAWLEAMLGQLPDPDEDLRQADAGINLRPWPKLIGEAEVQ